MGPFDNEKGIYVDTPGYLDGDWFVSDAGALYIVPSCEAEIEGPDDDISAALAKIYREDPSARISSICESLELDDVPHSLRRFDPKLGYYSA